MALEDTSSLGKGGSGFQGTGPGSAAAAIKELQGLKVAVLAGTTADTKIDVAAIRSEDTVLSCIELATGVPTDRTANTTISTLFATGTLTASTVVVGSECSVAGQSYVFQAGAPTTYGQVQVGVDDTASMNNLRDAINAYETSIERGGKQVTATAATGVVTVTAASEGTAGNSIALTTEDGTIVVSGATLTGGTATGGIEVDVDTSTDSLILMWYDKNA